MNPDSKFWVELCLIVGTVVGLPLLGIVFPEMWSTFLVLCQAEPLQALEFWQRILSAHTGFLTVLGIVLGFSGVTIFYEMRHYDEFLAQVQEPNAHAAQKVMERASGRFLPWALDKVMAEGEVEFPAHWNQKTALSQLVAMKDQFAVFARTYVAWGVGVLVFGAFVAEYLVLPPAILTGSEAIPVITVWIQLLGHLCTLLLAVSVLLGFFVLVRVALSEDKRAVDMINLTQRAIRRPPQAAAAKKKTPPTRTGKKKVNPRQPS